MNPGDILDQSCRSCGSQRISRVPRFDDLAKITSDCRLASITMGLGECIVCGLSQKLMSPSADEEINQIYKEYVTYKDNHEPIVFSVRC